MHKSTLTQIYLLTGLIVASLLLLPIAFLFILINSADPGVDQTLVSAAEAQVNLYDPAGQPTISLSISETWPANGYVAVEFGSEAAEISQSLVIVQSNPLDSITVQSIYDGEVVELDRAGHNDCGQKVVIQTEPNLRISYCSLQLIDPRLAVGKTVTKNETIALMGRSTGFDQPHLSLTTEVSGVKVNPRHFLKGDPLIANDLLVDF